MNVLVSSPVDTATPLSGTGLLDSGAQLAAAIESGNWVEGGMASVGVALDTAAVVVDPLGSLIGAGLGWLIDHLEPLKGWFNDFTGDAGEVAAFAQTWTNIQTQLHDAGDEVRRVLGDIDELAGQAMDAYRRFQLDAAQHLDAAASWAGAVSTGLQIASTIVQVVHDLVRDVLSQLVGSIISWAAEAVFSLGLATPVIISQVATKVAAWTAKVGKAVIQAVSSSRTLTSLLEELTDLFRRHGSLLDGTLRGSRDSAARVPSPLLAAEPPPMVRGATSEDIAADLAELRAYTGDGHEAMNDGLRGEIPMTPELQASVEAAVRALDRLPDHVATVFRGEHAEPGAPYLEKYQRGEIVTNQAFTSTDRVEPFQGNVQYEIESLHGKSVQHVSHHGLYEDEVLFRPGTHFLVTAREDINGTTFIAMREVE